MSLNRKTPKADLRKGYKVKLELGLIAVLALLIIAMKVEWRGGESDMDFSQEQEVVQMKEVVRTQQKKQPPPPPTPTVPVEVPNEKVLTDQEINLDMDFDLNEPLTAPEPPQNTGAGAEEKIFSAVQQMPVLTNREEFYGNVEYPRSCRLANVEGTVYVNFVVTETGEIENARVIQGIGAGCDEYALNYVVNNAEFQPGYQRGEAVSVRYTLNIVFNLR